VRQRETQSFKKEKN